MAHLTNNKHSQETKYENVEKILEDKLHDLKLSSNPENSHFSKQEDKSLKKLDKTPIIEQSKDIENSPAKKASSCEKTKTKDHHWEHRDFIHKEHRDSIHKEHKDFVHKERKDSIHKERKDSIHKERKDSIHKECKDSIYKERKDSIHKEFKDSIHKEQKDCVLRELKEKEYLIGKKRASQDNGKKGESKVTNDPKTKEIENKDFEELAACAKNEFINKNSKSFDNRDNTIVTDSDADDGYKTPDDFERDSETEDEYEEDLVIDEDHMKDLEKTMPNEEKKKRREEAQLFKSTGNDFFSKSHYMDAIKVYTKALQICPLNFANDRSILYSNRGACRAKLEENEEAILDCSKALELNRTYVKPLLRRAQLFEAIDKLDDALSDYQKVIELDPSQHVARQACMRLPSQIEERNEKLKQEMLSKLKDLGNMVLKPFGLSTNNFQLQQDPQTGSYSINFQQNAQQGK